MILNPVAFINYLCDITVKILFLVEYPIGASDHLVEAKAGEAEVGEAEGDGK